MITQSFNSEKAVQELAFGMQEMKSNVDQIYAAVDHANELTKRIPEILATLQKEISKFKV